MFLDKAQKQTLVDNMKEALAVEKGILALKKKTLAEEMKSAKKFTFMGETKKKSTKDPFDMEGFQKVLKTLSNELVDLKKQVVESSSSKRNFRSFKRTQQSPPPA